MVDSIASSVTDLVRELIGVAAFVEGAAPGIERDRRH
jgi:hypothetical protein